MMGDSICYFQYGGQERPLFERVALELEGIGNEPKKDLEENLPIERAGLPVKTVNQGLPARQEISPHHPPLGPLWL